MENLTWTCRSKTWLPSSQLRIHPRPASDDLLLERFPNHSTIEWLREEPGAYDSDDDEDHEKTNLISSMFSRKNEEEGEESEEEEDDEGDEEEEDEEDGSNQDEEDGSNQHEEDGSNHDEEDGEKDA